MYVHENAGRFDNVHGDEDYQERENQNPDDLMKIIADNGPDARFWIKELGGTDAFFHLLVIITKGRNKPEYKELVEALRIELEGLNG